MPSNEKEKWIQGYKDAREGTPLNRFMRNDSAYCDGYQVGEHDAETSDPAPEKGEKE